MKQEEAEKIVAEWRQLREQYKNSKRASDSIQLEQRIKELVVIMNANDIWTCAICGKVCVGSSEKNNAYPVKHLGLYCCNKCNQEVVIPARLKSVKTQH